MRDLGESMLSGEAERSKNIRWTRQCGWATISLLPLHTRTDLHLVRAVQRGFVVSTIVFSNGIRFEHPYEDRYANVTVVVNYGIYFR